MSNSKQRVLVAMSGGVDSSVAAALLVEQDYEVLGVTMQLWDYSKNVTSCNPDEKFDTYCSLDDVADARDVANKLGIPFYVFDYQKEFKENVVDYFVEEYLKGKTPNPCVACNTFLKFDLLLERAARLRCDFIATGHYARIVRDPIYGEYRLLKGVDTQKDQSYFLYSMDQHRLSKTLFPVGEMSKQEVRIVAEKYGLINAKKKESMEICFIPNNDYAKFVAKMSSQEDVICGDIYHEDGTYLGKHEGIHQFTIGQRKGLGIAAGKPLYVTRIQPETGRVYVGPEEHLLRQHFVFSDFHWVRKPEDKQSSFGVKIRYRAEPSLGTLVFAEDDVACVLDTPQRSVTPGQIAVLYRGDEVMGGGRIHRVLS